MHSAPIRSALLSLYLADRYSLGKKLIRMLEHRFIVLLCGHRGPETKKHMVVYAYTKGLLCNSWMLVAWARKELAKALFP